FGSSFSRDSKQVAYTWATRDTYEIRLVDIQGTGIPRSTVLVSNPNIYYVEAYDWTPDSIGIVVLIWRNDGSEQIALVSTADRSIRVLSDRFGAAHPFLTADGKRLAFDRGNDVVVLPLDGDQEESVVADSSTKVVMGWSPDGKYLLFASENTP